MKKNNITKLIILYFIVSIFTISFTITLLSLNKKPKETIVIKDNRNNIVEKEDNLVINLRNKYNNPDIIARVYIPNTNIDEPVMQTTNNEYYLSHNNSNEPNIHGSIYMDYRIDINKSKKILIFGHSSPYDNLDVVPFNELEEYYSSNYYKNHQDIILTLENEERKYKIFSVYVETTDFKYMNLNFEDIDAWYNHIKTLKNKSLYNTNIDIDEYDDILILQTCSNNKKYTQYEEKYLLVIAKRIK